MNYKKLSKITDSDDTQSEINKVDEGVNLLEKKVVSEETSRLKDALGDLQDKVNFRIAYAPSSFRYPFLKEAFRFEGVKTHKEFKELCEEVKNKFSKAGINFKENGIGRGWYEKYHGNESVAELSLYLEFECSDSSKEMLRERDMLEFKIKALIVKRDAEKEGFKFTFNIE